MDGCIALNENNLWPPQKIQIDLTRMQHPAFNV